MNYANLQSTLSQMFIQPQGSSYIISNSLEVSNVPLGAGISMAICPPESLLYVKFYQDGSPVIQAYSLTPYDSKSREHELEDIILKLQSKVDELENKLNSPAPVEGGTTNGLINKPNQSVNVNGKTTVAVTATAASGQAKT